MIEGLKINLVDRRRRGNIHGLINDRVDRHCTTML